MYGAGMMPARSVSSAKFSAEHLNESQTFAGSNTVTAKIFPLIRKVRAPQVTCSVAWGNERQRSVSQSMPPRKVTHSPTITVGMANARARRALYVQGAI